MSTLRLYPRPGDLIGHRRDGRPIYLLAGGAEPAMQVEPDDEGGGDGVESEDGGAKYTPPSRAEWIRLQASLVKANGSAKARREALAEKDKLIAELQAQAAKREADEERRALQAATVPPPPLPADPGGRKGKKGGGGVAPQAPPAPAPLPDSVLTKAQVRQMMAEAAREAKEQAAADMHGKLANSAARAALISEGVSKSGAARLVGMLDLDDIEFDEDGEVTGGLDDQVAQLKEDFPQLFRAPEPEKKVTKRTPVTRATPAGRQEQQEQPKSSAEKMAAMIMSGRQ